MSEPLYTPRYVLILTYDVKRGLHERYFRWMTGEFIPTVQSYNMRLQVAWHVIGVSSRKMPERRVEMVTKDREGLIAFFKSSDWQRAEERFKFFTEQFSYRITRFHSQFTI